ncbi:MAG: molybdenum cofactor guanylyltransferase MobA [Gammaproteobacteria bacterium]|jgi:molybdenum cofactor guanylyltransferase
MPSTSTVPCPDVTAVILAGGKARRMGGEDKGLIELHGRPLLDYIIAGLRPQTAHLLINANRNLDRYRAFGYPVAADTAGDFLGPLAGMATGMQNAATPFLLAVPCDSPFVPAQLCTRLRRALDEADAEISVAHDGVRMQPVYTLLRCTLLPSLQSYLGEGERRIDGWYARHRLALADFSGSPEVFLNLNTPADRRRIENKLAGNTGACSGP